MKFYLLSTITLCLFVLIIISYYLLLQSSFICSNYEFRRNVIPSLCQNTTPQTVILPVDSNDSSFSNLCAYLCSTRNQLEATCHAHHLNKQYVFTIKGKSEKHPQIIIKSIIEDDEDEEAYWKQKNIIPYIPTPDELRKMVSSHIVLFLGKVADKSLKEIDSSLFRSQIPDLSLHADLWKFIYDHEFLTAYLFHNYRLFPRILGICRNFYAVEYAKPLMENPLLPFGIPWNLRIERAIELLHLIEKFRLIWKEPIHLCDMKHDHFGWNNGEVLFLDLDGVLTESALKNIMVITPQCSYHEDCSFFDCLGECLPAKQCSGRRRNSNLQILCNKIFLGNSESSVISLFGLLNAYDSTDTLRDALELCSTNPGMTTEVLIQILQNEYNSIEIHSTEL